MNLQIDESIMVTSRSCQPILAEKAVVELQPGSLWTRVLRDDEVVGIIFAGEAHFAVDAIAETPAGAVGESITDDLEGCQLVLGDLDIVDASREASEDDLHTNGFDTAASFLEKARSILNDAQLRKARIPSNHGRVLIGHTLTNSSLVLVVSKDKLVFVYRDRTFVVTDDTLIEVRKDRLRVYGRHGRVFGLSMLGHDHQHHESIIDVGVPQPWDFWDDSASDCCPPHMPHRRIPRYDWHRATHDWDPDWVV
ncbi:MAG: hypothetical protein ACTSYL_07300 [Candidatus Thorarchaeota archaeon]